MNSSFQIARVMGIPIVVNLSWLLTLAFVSTALALWAYPAVFEPTSPYRNDKLVHWSMAIVSGLVFFGSILLHELAHSVVALKQGIPVKSITLFIFGGVSQIGGEARRPLHEFVMAVIGPLTSLLLAVLFFAAWWITGFSSTDPVAVVLEWLFLMNLVLAVFNMAPGFPMDGGRVLRAVVWGLSGNSLSATRVATLAGRGLGYGMMVLGGLVLFGTLNEVFEDQWSGLWLILLGMYLENAAKQSWFQAKALDILGRHFAEDVMHLDLETAGKHERLHYLASRGGNRYIFFVTDDDERVVGVLTQREVAAVPETDRGNTTAGDAMRPTSQFPVALPREDGSSMLQRMEEESLWHMPVVSEGRVIGVVNKEDLLRLLARGFFPEAKEAPPLPR